MGYHIALYPRKPILSLCWSFVDTFLNYLHLGDIELLIACTLINSFVFSSTIFYFLGIKSPTTFDIQILNQLSRGKVWERRDYPAYSHHWGNCKKWLLRRNEMQSLKLLQNCWPKLLCFVLKTKLSLNVGFLLWKMGILYTLIWTFTNKNK